MSHIWKNVPFLTSPFTPRQMCTSRLAGIPILPSRQSASRLPVPTQQNRTQVHPRKHRHPASIEPHLQEAGRPASSVVFLPNAPRRHRPLRQRPRPAVYGAGAGRDPSSRPGSTADRVFLWRPRADGRLVLPIPARACSGRHRATCRPLPGRRCPMGSLRKRPERYCVGYCHRNRPPQ